MRKNRWRGDRALYRDSAAWAALSMATRRQRENIFKHVINSAGSFAFASIDKVDIAAGRDKRAKTPAQANSFLKAMRGLFGEISETRSCLSFGGAIVLSTLHQSRSSGMGVLRTSWNSYERVGAVRHRSRDVWQDRHPGSSEVGGEFDYRGQGYA